LRTLLSPRCGRPTGGTDSHSRSTNVGSEANFFRSRSTSSWLSPLLGALLVSVSFVYVGPLCLPSSGCCFRPRRAVVLPSSGCCFRPRYAVVFVSDGVDGWKLVREELFGETLVWAFWTFVGVGTLCRRPWLWRVDGETSSHSEEPLPIPTRGLLP
jgi:hypothetical protein